MDLITNESFVFLLRWSDRSGISDTSILELEAEKYGGESDFDVTEKLKTCSK